MIIDQRVGRDTVLIEAVNDALPSLYMKALDENDITPLSQPEMEMDQIEDGEAVKFRAELDIAPKIELPEFHGLEAEVEAIAVDDAVVGEQLDLLRQRFGTLTPVERAAGKDDFVTLDLSAAHDGEPIEEAQATGMSYQVGRGTMLAGLDDALEGMSAGDEKTFESMLAAGEYRDQPVDVTVKVTAVKQQDLPELDDEFAQTASEFDTVAELRADVRERAVRSARMEQAEAARDAVLKKLLTLIEVPLPDAAVQAEVESRRTQLGEQLSYAGMTEADYLAGQEQSEEDYLAELDSRVREAMAAQFVLEEIAKVEQTNVEEAELTDLLLRRAQESGISPEEYVKHAVEHNHVPELMGEIRRGKALAHVVVTADVKDSNGEHVELATLMPDGTYAEVTESETAEGAEDDGQPHGATATGDAASGLVVAGDYAIVEDEDA
jgi:trigger factor